MTDLISLGLSREEARAAGKRPLGNVLCVTAGEPKALSGGRRGFRFCFSDSTVDRMGDTIAASGWDTHNFLKNPVALWAHDSSSPPIGRASNIMVEGERLMGDIEFAAADVYPFAETIYRLTQEKFINAVSVGFLPIDWKWADDEDEGRRWGIDFSRQELLEISIVPVPANANALIEARAKGIDVGPAVEWAEKLLDGCGRVMVPKSELEKLRKAAKEPRMRRSITQPTTNGIAGARKELLSEYSSLLARIKADENKLRAQIKADGMSETDPSSGGDLVDCGEDADEPCGLDDPSKCMVHGNLNKSEDEDNDMDEKTIVALFRRELRTARREIAAEIEAEIAEIVRREFIKSRGPFRRAEGGDPDDLLANEHIEHMKTAHFHAKECVKCLKKAIDATSGDEDDDVIPSEEPNPEGEKLLAARRARAAQLRAAAA